MTNQAEAQTCARCCFPKFIHADPRRTDAPAGVCTAFEADRVRVDFPPEPQCDHPKLMGGPLCATKDCTNSIGTKQFDVIQKAAHYNQHPSGVEAIDVVRHMSFNVGNAMKYLWRADLKENPLQDLKKARYYIEDEINRREAAQ